MVCLCDCGSNAMVWVHPQLLQQGDTLQGWLHVPGRQHSPETTQRARVLFTKPFPSRYFLTSVTLAWESITEKTWKIDFSPACLPLHILSPHPLCQRASRRSEPVCISSLNCRWPPAGLLGSPPASLRLLCLSPCGPPPTQKKKKKKDHPQEPLSLTGYVQGYSRQTFI